MSNTKTATNNNNNTLSNPNEAFFFNNIALISSKDGKANALRTAFRAIFIKNNKSNEAGAAGAYNRYLKMAINDKLVTPSKGRGMYKLTSKGKKFEGQQTNTPAPKADKAAPKGAWTIVNKKTNKVIAKDLSKAAAYKAKTDDQVVRKAVAA